jgi:Enoyl-CoA hydratase/isomerase
MEAGGLLEVRRDGAATVLVLRRESKLNALSSALEQALLEALEGEEVRGSAVVVLAGAGRAFSAGADVNELRDVSPESVAAYYRASGQVYERVAALPQPTLAAVHGYCLGGGLELALAADSGSRTRLRSSGSLRCPWESSRAPVARTGWPASWVPRGRRSSCSCGRASMRTRRSRPVS